MIFATIFEARAFFIGPSPREAGKSFASENALRIVSQRRRTRPAAGSMGHDTTDIARCVPDGYIRYSQIAN
jgi:hypothetical protein